MFEAEADQQFQIRVGGSEYESYFSDEVRQSRVILIKFTYVNSEYVVYSYTPGMLGEISAVLM